MENTIIFDDYLAGLPSLTTLPADTDTVMLIKGGSLYQVKLSQTRSANNLFVNAVTGQVTGALETNLDVLDGNVTLDISGFTDVTIYKVDNGLNTITIVDSSGNTVIIDPLNISGQGVRLVLFENVWLKQ